MKIDAQQIAMVGGGAALLVVLAKNYGGKKASGTMAMALAATAGAVVGQAANDAYNKKKSQTAINNAAAGLLPSA